LVNDLLQSKNKMKSFLSAILMILSTRVLAQDSVPPFTELSKQVYQCLRHKDYGCLEKNMLSLDEMIKSLNALMKDYQKEKESVTTFDSNTLAPLLSHRNTQNIDAFYERAKQLKINWDRVEFVSVSDSTVDSYMLSQFGTALAQCTIKISEGQNIYGIDYGLRFINKQWKIEEIHPYIVVYEKDGRIKGVMRQDGYDTDVDALNPPKKKT
jgi:hypothetical protein